MSHTLALLGRIADWTRRPSGTRLLHWIGGALAFAGVIFVALRLREHGSHIDLARFSGIGWIALTGLAVLYGLSSMLLALAWRNLLAFRGEQTGFAWAVRTYGISQLAKYIPGNIAHFLGRQAIGLSAGLGGWPLAQSALWELGLICAAGAVFGALAIPLLTALSPWLASGLFIASAATALIVTRRLFGPLAATALLQQMTFLALSGAIFIGSAFIVAPLSLTVTSWTAICGAYVLAWLAGLVTPGAPAGVGVREAVLLFLLGDVMAPADLLLAIVTARVVCVLGDCLFFGAAWAIGADDPQRSRVP